MDDVDPRLSKLILACAALGAAANLASSVRHRGARRATRLLALGIGLPAVGELLATGPLKLLRHRAQPRIGGVPISVLLGWYCATNGSLTAAERVLDRLPLDRTARRRALPPAAALVGTGLDLVLDPAGLDAGLWEWNLDGYYAADVEGPNARSGVPLVNYLGWLALVGGAVYLDRRSPGDDAGERRKADLVPVLVLLPCYLAAAAWAVKRRRFRYLLYSVAFPVALAASLGEPNR